MRYIAAFFLICFSLSAENDLQKQAYFFAKVWPKMVSHHCYKFAVAMENSLGHGGNDKYDIKPIGFAVDEPLGFEDGDELPTKGVWTQRFSLIRGEQKRIYNFCVGFIGTGESTIFPRVMGETVASLPLELDVLPAVSRKAQEKLKMKMENEEFNKSMVVIDTKPHPGSAELENVGVFIEDWTIRAYSEETIVEVVFMQSEKGTTFLVR